MVRKPEKSKNPKIQKFKNSKKKENENKQPVGNIYKSDAAKISFYTSEYCWYVSGRLLAEVKKKKGLQARQKKKILIQLRPYI